VIVCPECEHPVPSREHAAICLAAHDPHPVRRAFREALALAPHVHDSSCALLGCDDHDDHEPERTWPAVTVGR